MISHTRSSCDGSDRLVVLQRGPSIHAQSLGWSPELHARARLTTSRWHVEVGEARAWREFERDLTSGIVPEALNKRASKNEDADRSRSDAIGGDMRFARRSFQDT